MFIQKILPVATMPKFICVSSAGLVISFLGSLPLGTMNIAATNISISEGVHAGWLYATGSMLIEIIIVRAALTAMGWFLRKQKLFWFLELFTTAVIVVMAIGCFVAAYKMTGFSGSLPKIFSLHPFWTGVLLSISNPLHIPFWMGWNTVLINKKILLPSSFYYNFYIMGIAVGTLLGFAVFIYGGNYMIAAIIKHQGALNVTIGLVLLVTAAIQVRKMIAFRLQAFTKGNATT